LDYFLGYERPDGSYGTRNYIAIIPTVICANRVVEKIASKVNGVIALSHSCGCCQIEKDLNQTFRTLVGLGLNSNVYGVVVVGLGCEAISGEKLVDEISKSGKSVYHFNIQNEGGTVKSIKKGVKIVKKLSEEAQRQKRKTACLSELIVGTECGGSDWTSGVAANPAVGFASDLIVENGGTVILSETTELVGAEHILAKRAVNEAISKKIFEIVTDYEERIRLLGGSIREGQPTPGNIVGGITTLEEKSLGAIYKAGNSKIVDVVDYGERVNKKGLVIMNTPGCDVESLTGMVAGGAQLIIFTTGRGTPTGNPIAPVIKVTGNPLTFEKMKDNIDINAGKILSHGLSIRDVGQEIFKEIISVASGKLTKAEHHGHYEMAIWRTGLSL
jgi:altronate dehydratase large subunit